jgi:hypothetical protein
VRPPFVVCLWQAFWPVALTYAAVLVAEVFFRAGSVGDALALLGGMIGVNGIELPATSLRLTVDLSLGLCVLLIAFFAPNVYQIMDNWSPALTKVRSSLRGIQLWHPNFRWALIGGVLLFAASLRFDQSAPFLYFQF